MRYTSKRMKRFLSITTIAYGLLLLYVLFFRRMGLSYSLTYIEYLQAMHNFIPFKSVYVLLTTPVLSERVIIPFVVNFLGNIILFIPWGIMFPTYDKKAKSVGYFVALTIITLFFIETMQILTMLGIFDIEDILLNMTGAFIGFAVYRRHCSAESEQKDRCKGKQ